MPAERRIDQLMACACSQSAQRASTHACCTAEAMIGPLIYWVLVASVLGYYLLTAATQYLPASQVSSQTKPCRGSSCCLS